MTIISGVGLQIQLLSSVTFPGGGLILTQFADDTDPLDLGELQIGDGASGLNGDLEVWSKANPIEITLGIIPNSSDDINLGILFEANRPGKGKIVANDIITLTGIYQDGSTTTYTGGWCISYMPGLGVQSSARFKSKPYKFKFENVTVT